VIHLKRAYEPASDDDGKRILVDRLWPRGVSKEKAALDRWAKELSPSPELCKWFHHDPDKWVEFQTRYERELEGQTEALKQLAKEASAEKVTLIYGARDEEHNQALVLKAVLDRLGESL